MSIPKSTECDWSSEYVNRNVTFDSCTISCDPSGSLQQQSLDKSVGRAEQSAVQSGELWLKLWPAYDVWLVIRTYY